MLMSDANEINQNQSVKWSISAKNLNRFGKGAMSNVNNIGNYGRKTVMFLFLLIRACAIMILPLCHPPPPTALSLSDCFRIDLELKELLSAFLLTRPFISSSCCLSGCLCHHGYCKALSLNAGTSSSA